MKVKSALFVLMLILSTSSFAKNVEELKIEIFQLAESFKGQMDTDGSKQKELEVLVAELVAQVPERTMEEKAISAVGVWNQVWGPYAFDDSNRMPPGIDADKIYQYISDKGYYYNFAEYNFWKLKLKFFLRGNYTIKEDRINVVFTNQGLISEDSFDYAYIGEEIEAQSAQVRNFPTSIPPAGVKGALVEVYSDQEIRINYGVVGDDLENLALFVMRRVK